MEPRLSMSSRFWIDFKNGKQQIESQSGLLGVLPLAIGRAA